MVNPRTRWKVALHFHLPHIEYSLGFLQFAKVSHGFPSKTPEKRPPNGKGRTTGAPQASHIACVDFKHFCGHSFCKVLQLWLLLQRRLSFKPESGCSLRQMLRTSSACMFCALSVCASSVCKLPARALVHLGLRSRSPCDLVSCAAFALVHPAAHACASTIARRCAGALVHLALRALSLLHLVATRLTVSPEAPVATRQQAKPMAPAISFAIRQQGRPSCSCAGGSRKGGHGASIWRLVLSLVQC